VAKSELTFFKRVSILTALCIALLVGGRAPAAQAQVAECEGIHAQIAKLSRQESRRGLTQELQETIDAIVPLIDACGLWHQGSWPNLPEEIRRWVPLVSTYFRPEDVGRALCLMEHESAGDHLAQNPASGASGLMQIMPFWAGHLGYQVDSLFDPAINLRIAAYIRDEQGWDAWNPFGRGLCQS
jgi:Transglycosylase SLT domain